MRRAIADAVWNGVASRRKNDWNLVSATEEMFREHAGTHFTQRSGWHLFMFCTAFVPMACTALVARYLRHVMVPESSPLSSVGNTVAAEADEQMQRSSEGFVTQSADNGPDSLQAQVSSLAQRIGHLEHSVGEIKRSIHSSGEHTADTSASNDPHKASSGQQQSTSQSPPLQHKENTSFEQVAPSDGSQKE